LDTHDPKTGQSGATLVSQEIARVAGLTTTIDTLIGVGITIVTFGTDSTSVCRILTEILGGTFITHGTIIVVLAGLIELTVT
jgi:hypothetical protein